MLGHVIHSGQGSSAKHTANFWAPSHTPRRQHGGLVVSPTVAVIH